MRSSTDETEDESQPRPNGLPKRVTKTRVKGKSVRTKGRGLSPYRSGTDTERESVKDEDE